ncbi:hypothetical protein INT45_012164 [Circinella minor]|uniref:N-acetyltransferase domain-containing protein n=1 Tax=Circinella minor TaxID=1195481 RepID=A0A8H7SAC4_9FUNG|nr:hypothetical protein INT45_012164 [Circinella minor]
MSIITLADDYIIRLVKEQDLSFILDIFNECVLDQSTLLYYETVTLDYIKEWYQLCHSKGYPAIVICNKITDQPIAYAYLTSAYPYPVFNLTTMLAIYISSAHRRRGLGRVLVSELLNMAKEQKFKNVIASTNTASVKLFESFKFQYCGKMEYWAYNFGRFIDGLTFQYIIQETNVQNQERPTFEPFQEESYKFIN